MEAFAIEHRQAHVVVFWYCFKDEFKMKCHIKIIYETPASSCIDLAQSRQCAARALVLIDDHWRDT